MFVLRLTSPGYLDGMQTDDDFTIGKFSSSTIVLLSITTIFGGLTGAIYLAVRQWFPRRWAMGVAARLGAFVGGSLVIGSEGVDFSLVGPVELSVAMFIVIPAACGATTSWLCESMLRSGWWRRSRASWLPLTPIGLLVAIPLVGIPAIAAYAAAVAGQSRIVRDAWRSRQIAWVGRGGTALVAALGFQGLVRDLVAIF